MSAQMDFNKYNNGITIDDFMEGRVFSLCPSDHAIVNMCLTNGTMGRKDQLKLRELYPNLFDAVTNFLSKTHGKLFIYEEENKPKVVNIFVHQDAKENSGTYSYRINAKKSLIGYVRSGKIPSKNLIFIDSDERKHQKMIEGALKYNLRWEYIFTALREELPECRQEEETDF